MLEERGSAIIVVLFMMLVLSVIVTSLLNFSYFYFSDSLIIYEKSKLKLISEKELFFLLKDIQNQNIDLTLERKTNTDNFVYEVSKKIEKKGETHTVELLLKGDKYSIKRYVDFIYIPLFYFSFYINTEDFNQKLNYTPLIQGYSFVSDLSKLPYKANFVNQFPSLFARNTNVTYTSIVGNIYLTESEIEGITLKLDSISNTTLISHLDFKVNIPEIVKKALTIVDKDWHITSYSSVNTEEFTMPLYFRKILLGRYNSRPLNYTGKDIENVYFLTSYKKEVDPYEDTDTFGSRGFFSKLFLKLQDGKLDFTTSPVKVALPAESFSKPFEISLDIENSKLVSTHRKIKGVFLDNPNDNLLASGEIKLENNKIIIVSEELKNKYYYVAGEGDGFRKSFQIPNITPQFVYLDGERTVNFYVNVGSITFNIPPPRGSKIVIMKEIPEIYISKDPPQIGTYVYVDRKVKCVKINFNDIENLPKNRLIFSTLPIIISGSPNEAVVVISTEDIFVSEDVNQSSEDNVLVLISRKGIFLDEKIEKIYNIMMISALDGVYKFTKFHDSDLRNFPKLKLIKGSVILTSELKNHYLSKSDNSYILSRDGGISEYVIASEKILRECLSGNEFSKTVRYILPSFKRILRVK